MRGAINKMKDDKAAGCSWIVTEMLKASGDTGVWLVTELINSIIKEELIPEDWHKSIIVNLFKGKGDSLDAGNYRGLKMLDQVMKVFERVREGMTRNSICIIGCHLHSQVAAGKVPTQKQGPVYGLRRSGESL